MVGNASSRIQHGFEASALSLFQAFVVATDQWADSPAAGKLHTGIPQLPGIIGNNHIHGRVTGPEKIGPGKPVFTLAGYIHVPWGSTEEHHALQDHRIG